VQILIKRKVDGPSVPELGTPTSVTFDSITVPLNRASTGPAALAQYELQRSLDGNTWATIATGPSIFGNPPVQFVDGGRIALTTYYYRARALDVAGRASGYSATVSATTAATIAPSTALLFPRVGSYWIGNFDYELTSVQQAAAQFDLLIWNMAETWGSWKPQPRSFAACCAAVKAINPAIKLFQYVNPYDMWSRSVPASDPNPNAVTTGIYPVIESLVSSRNWWVRKEWPSGSRIISPDYNAYLLNLSINAPSNSSSYLLNGKRPIEHFLSTYISDMYVQGVYPQYHAANPHLDGFFVDNVLIEPAHQGDWNMDGTTAPTEGGMGKSDVSTALAFRQGLAAGADALRAQFPSMTVLGNLIPYTFSAGYARLTTNPDPTMRNKYDGALLEHWSGEFYSPETWGGPGDMINAAKSQANHLTKPDLQLMHSSRRSGSELFQDMRQAVCSSLIVSNGHIAYSNNSFASTGATNVGAWYDEYGNYGTLPRYYLGVAEDLPVTSESQTWTSGVYRRRFQNGWVLWNPRGNGVRTVNLGQTMRKLQGRSGFSDTTVNNGAQVTSVTLQDRDGLVLLKV
jgi:hypothetical protein